MAALEYLTGNALTSHPFRPPKNTTFVATHPIEGNGNTEAVWFYDILFVAYLDDLRRVFISNISKISDTQVSLIFSDCDTGEVITPSEQPVILNLVNHFKNTSVSFASWKTSGFSVKVVLGPGLLNKDNFNQNYPKELTELSSAAIILKSPRVTSLTFNAYDTYKARDLGLPLSHKFEVASYNKTTTEPRIKLKHNIIYNIESSSALGLVVSRGAGEGLYNPCPGPGDIEDVYSITQTTPDENGNIFLSPSNCYFANTLTSNDVLLLGDQVLNPYREFELYSPDGNGPIYNAVSVGTSIFIQNCCKPKCAPEQIQAFAHYLNRVTDGAQELDQIAAKNVQTHGICNIQDNVLIALSFCDDEVFSRCNIPCGTSFIKNFHEGREVRISYSSTDLRSFKIMEVISPSIIKVDQLADYGAALAFEVLDTGVISNMNCAIAEYNTKSLSYLKPYFSVKYTTSESYSSQGIYTTFLSVVVAIFNPSSEVVALRVAFDYQVFALAGKFKIRKENGVEVSDYAETYVGCREYVFVEAVFGIGCGVSGGAITISVFDTTQGADVLINSPYVLPGINGVPCPSGGSTTTPPPIFKLLQANWQGYTKTIKVSDFVTSMTFTGNKPSWLNLAFNNTTKLITLSVPADPADSLSALYSMGYTSNYGGTGTFKLLYINKPIINTSLLSTYTSSFPLYVDKDVLYTSSTPLLEIVAANMVMLAPDFPADALFYYHILHIFGNSSALPPGLIFNKDTGKLIGQLSSTVRVGTKISLYVSARNPAGLAINPQVIYLEVVSSTEPPYSGTFYYYEGQTEVDTYSTWASSTSWFEDSSHLLRATTLPLSVNPVVLLNDTSANLENWTPPASISLNGNNLKLTAHNIIISPPCAPAVIFTVDVTGNVGDVLTFEGHIQII
jgi:hypothetical protein